MSVSVKRLIFCNSILYKNNYKKDTSPKIEIYDSSGKKEGIIEEGKWIKN